jgi:hypothetical protein
LGLIFANPFGLSALAGLAVVVVVHLLRHRPHHVVVSTLFLLDALDQDEQHGRSIRRLRSTLPLWLQLAAVLVATWLIVDPRFVAGSSVQRVVVVLDTSASMSAYRELALLRLRARIGMLGRAAAATEWIVVPSHEDGATLFAGARAESLSAALDAWHPERGTHDPVPVLSLARRLAGSQGVVLYVTDHDAAVPPGVTLLAVGAPLDNVGFAGLEIERAETVRWVTLLKSYASTEQTRTWWVEVDGVRGPEQVATLPPGAASRISGELPEAGARITLRLSGDAFALDDVLPIVAPEAKSLRVHVPADVPVERLAVRLLEALDAIDRVPREEDADVVWRAVPAAGLDAAVAALDKPAIVSVVGADGVNAQGFVIAAKESLADGLRWDGLDCLAAGATERNEGTPLVWRGDAPLVTLLGRAASATLVLHMDPSRCNAARVPAFVVLIARFLDTVRAAKLAPESRNVETLEGVVLPHGGIPLRLRAEGAAPAGRDVDVIVRPSPGALATVRAPGAPGFFAVTRDDVVLLRGAAHFADVREADLRRAASRDTALDAGRTQALANSARDPLRAVWLTVLAALVLAAWWLEGSARAAARVERAPA